MRRVRRGPAARFLLALAVAGCGGAAGGGAGAVAPANGARIYVTNQDEATITVVDGSTHAIVDRIDLTALGFGPNAKPHHIAVEPDGSYWYVSLIGENTVLKLDAANRIVDRVEFEVPGLLALDSRSDRLYVGRSMSAVNPPQRLGVIDRRAMTIEELPVLIPRPHALAANPAAGLAYSASLAENRMAVVDAADEEVELRPLPTPAGHAGHAGMHGDMEGMVHTVVDFAVSPDGRTLVASGEVSGELLVFDISDPWDPERITQVAVEDRPWEPRFTSDGRWVWLSNLGADAVTLVDARDWSVAAVVRGEGLSEPYGVAISPDDRFVYVTNQNLKGRYPGVNGTLVVIDARARQIVKVIPVGRNPTGIGTNARR